MFQDPSGHAGLFSKIVSAVKSTATKVTKTVTKTVSTVAKKVTSAAKSVASTVKSAVKKAVNTVKTTVKTVASKVTSTAKTVAKKVVEVANTAKEKIISATTAVVNKAKDVATTVIKEVKSSSVYQAAEAAYNYVQETKQAAVETVSRYVEKKVTEIKVAATEAWENTKDAVEDCLDVVIEVKQKAAEVVQEVGVWWEESDLSKKLNETAQELNAAWENSAIGKTVAAIETQVNKAAEVISQKWNESAIGQFANKAVNAVTDFYEEHKTAINFIAGAVVIGLCAVAVIATGPLGCCLMHTVAVGALKGALVGAAAGLASGAFGSAVSYYEENGTLDGSTDEILEGASTGFVTGSFSGAMSGGMDGGMKYIKNPKGFCFVAGTLVLTCLGFVSIETIRPGDYVYSKNMATGAIEEQAVLDVYEREVYETYSITIGDEEIEATAEHPFYTLDDGWVAAEDLEVGDEVATADGESETVDDIVKNILEEPVTVYNFAVMDNHNYFVGENKLLVHNTCVKNPKVSESKLEKAIEKHADAVKRDRETELFLPDEYYKKLNKEIHKGYQAPNTKEVYRRLGNTSNEIETSIVISDDFGRIKYRIDYTTHGRDLSHTNPHIHEFIGSTGKGDYHIHQRKYFMDESTGRMRHGKANNDGTYRWLDMED